MPKRKAETQETCNICLDSVKNKASLDGCSHTFCRKCIVKWAKTSNTCPCCRKDFTEVKTAKSKKKIKRARQTVEDDRRLLLRNFIMETLTHYISSDDFKDMLHARFWWNPDPMIHFICRHLRRILNDSDFRDHIVSLNDHEARDELIRARDAIESMYNLAPGSTDNPISIAI